MVTFSAMENISRRLVAFDQESQTIFYMHRNKPGETWVPSFKPLPAKRYLPEFLSSFSDEDQRTLQEYLGNEGEVPFCTLDVGTWYLCRSGLLCLKVADAFTKNHVFIESAWVCSDPQDQQVTPLEAAEAVSKLVERFK